MSNFKIELSIFLIIAIMVSIMCALINFITWQMGEMNELVIRKDI